MLLEGSCHCGAVRFRLRSRHPYPFNLCYCSICRKTAGAGGYAINLGGEHASLEVDGREHSGSTAREPRDAAGRAGGEPRRAPFLRPLRQPLWLWDPRWPELVHPLAAAIDTPLPIPPERTHLMLASKAAWAVPAIGPQDQQFAAYPAESIAAWHERLGLVGDEP